MGYIKMSEFNNSRIIQVMKMDLIKFDFKPTRSNLLRSIILVIRLFKDAFEYPDISKP